MAALTPLLVGVSVPSAVATDRMLDAIEHAPPESTEAFRHDAGEVGVEPPQLATLLETGIDHGSVSVAVEELGGYGCEVVDEGQIGLRMPEVGGRVDQEGACVGAHKVVLLRVAVQEGRSRFGT